MPKPRSTKHTVTWTHPITGKPRSLELTHTRDYLNAGNDQLEIRSVRPRNAPHPLSATGYFSRFMDVSAVPLPSCAVATVPLERLLAFRLVSPEPLPLNTPAEDT